MISVAKDLTHFSIKGGVLVILGADGAGKSTQLQFLRKYFLSTEQRDTVRFFYMGSGDGSVSWYRFPLQKMYEFYSKFNRKSLEHSSLSKIKGASSKNPRGLFLFVKILYSLTLSYEKYFKLRKIHRLRLKGYLCICDRYPQFEVFGYNDGPHLRFLQNSPFWILRKLSSLEFSHYALSTQVFPDVVVKLFADPQILYDRKPGETALEKIIRKQEGILKIQFGPKSQEYKIDATLPVEKVQQIILDFIIQHFGEKNG